MPGSLDQIDHLTKVLRDLEPLKPEYREKLEKKFRLEFNYNSNHLEGNTLTYGETELLLLFDDTKGNHSLREYEEMKAHDLAYKMVQERAVDKERPLNEQFIRELNKIILVRSYWKEAQTYDGQTTRREILVGDYKKYPNSVRQANGEMFNYTTPADTPMEMQALMDWYHAEKDAIHPVTLAAMLHYKLVRIHPFDDGNGRISRLLVNYVLLNNNLPPIVIKSSDKQNYLRALHAADAGDFEPFIEYIVEQVLWSLEISIRGAKGEEIEEPDDIKKEISILSTEILSKGSRSKSPKNIYQVFTEFKKNVWPEVLDSVCDFEQLFEEKKEHHFVNSRKELVENRNLLHQLSERLSETEKIRIFGLDIYEEDVKEIEWKLILYGVKRATGNLNIEIDAKIIFDTDMYSINFLIDRISFYDSEFIYGASINESDIAQVTYLLSKSLFLEIKTRAE